MLSAGMRRLMIILTVLVIAPAGWAQMVLYAASGNGNLSKLYTVDPLTAQATLIGDVLAGTTPMVITGLAFHPLTGVLYGVTGNEFSPSRRLVTIDPLTAQATLLGTLGALSTEAASDISFAADGTLYAWTTRGGPFASIDLGTGLRTSIGTALNGTQGNGLSFTPDGTLYVAGPNEPGNLYTVNVSTGAITSVATFSNVPVGLGVINAMASDPTGLLYASGRSSGMLVTINRSTAAMTLVGTLSFGEADALAFGFAAIPEPSTWTLLAVGMGAVLISLRRRRDR